jgi:predicted dehydrogenase
MTVRWGILGAGWIVTTATAQAIHEADGAVLRATAARDIARASATEPQTAYDRYEAVLDDPAVDAVYIALSNEAHLPWILASLGAGKHVLCEKPLTLTHAHAQQAFDAAERAGLLLVEAAWSRWHPRMQRAIERVRTGAVGAVTEFAGAFTFDGVPEGNYRLEPDRGGGALYDVGVYPLHSLVAMMSDPHALHVREVSAVASPTGVDLSTTAILAWNEESTASIEASFIQPERQILRIAGTEGTIELDGQAYTSWREPSTLRIGGRVEEFAPVDAYRLMVEQVSAAIRGEPNWVVPPAESLAVARLLDMLRPQG